MTNLVQIFARNVSCKLSKTVSSGHGEVRTDGPKGALMR